MSNFLLKVNEFNKLIKCLEDEKQKFINGFQELQNKSDYQRNKYIKNYPVLKLENDLTWREEEIYTNFKDIRDQLKQRLFPDSDTILVNNLSELVKVVSVKKGYSEYFVNLLWQEVRYLIYKLEHQKEIELAKYIREVFHIEKKE